MTTVDVKTEPITDHPTWPAGQPDLDLGLILKREREAENEDNLNPWDSENNNLVLKTELPSEYPSWESGMPVLPNLDLTVHPAVKQEIIESSQHINSSPVYSPNRGMNLSFSHLNNNRTFTVTYPFESRMHFDMGHRFKCLICRDTYLSTYEYNHHLLHSICGYTAERRFFPAKISKRKPYRFVCQLCFRRYTSFGHLYHHQVRRCRKRYISPNWVVKI